MTKRKTNSGSITYSGSVAVTTSATTTASAATLLSLVTAGSRFLNNLGDIFQLYRFTKLEVDIFPYQTVTANAFAVFGYQQDISDTAPTSVSQVVDLGCSQYMMSSQTVPVKFKVPRSRLMASVNKWYRTQLPSQTNTGSGSFSTSDVWESTQGVVWVLANATVTLQSIWRYTVELSSAAAPGLTPSPRVRLEKVMGWRSVQFETDIPTGDDPPKKEIDSCTLPCPCRVCRKIASLEFSDN